MNCISIKIFINLKFACNITCLILKNNNFLYFSFIRKQIIDCLQNKIEKLGMSQIEYVCLKAILALDSSAVGINSATIDMLSVARDSVQNALFLHLVEKYSSQQAVFRFGQLLILISNASVSLKLIF